MTSLALRNPIAILMICIGLVVFAREAYTHIPLTLDHLRADRLVAKRNLRD